VSSDLRATAEQLRPLGARLSALAENADTARWPTRARIPHRPRARQSPDGDADPVRGLELLRLAVVIAIVLAGAVIWRFLALRYIADASSFRTPWSSPDLFQASRRRGAEPLRRSA